MTRVVIALLTLTGLATAQDGRQPAPPAPQDFAVMAWGGSPSDPEQLRGMREAGLNISGFCHWGSGQGSGRRADLLRERAAIDSVDLLHLPPDDELRAHIAELKKQIGDNPAALGFFLRDEPDVPACPGSANWQLCCAKPCPTNGLT